MRADLIREIERFIPYNEQEAKDKRLILQMLHNEPDIFKREHLSAHMTASAWVVNEDLTKTLMIYHNLYDSWAWMGGHADGEEDLLKTAIREVREESGLQMVEPISDEIYSLEVLTVDGHEKRGQYVSSHLHFNITYLLKASEEETIRIKPDENSGVAWFQMEDAVQASTEVWFQQRIYPKLIEKLYADPEQFFRIESIPDFISKRIEGISYRSDCPVERKDLRYLRILHTGFDHKTHVGELICHMTIAEDLKEIFMELYKARYPIEKMVLVDEYGGDDELSMADNNSSCFNDRTIAGTHSLSEHAYGKAVDINPLYNPYVLADGSYTPRNAGDYIDRSKNIPGKIDHKDLCYRLFTQKGFEWGGDWEDTKDYQHFQMGKRKKRM